MERGRLHSSRVGFRVHYRVEPWSPYIEIHWGPLGQAYVTPVGTNEICVAVVTRFREAARTSEVVQGIPFLAEKLRHAEAVTRERGAVTTTRSLDRVVRENIALIGDASGSVDAITGEGMALGFRQARLLARAISEGGLASYQEGHAEILRLPRTMACTMLLLDRWPGVRRRTLNAMARDPALLAKMLRVHMGEEPLRRFMLEHAPRLGCRMLLPSHA
jgi:menaquinone-9 beta-reductase